ncbi:SWI/SNF related-matrix-associated actin-dependent regulator of chromatin subfamily C [Nematocida sp. AWRm80]|nr:SWI/SNF related-matrix-associated actin-dependent regulator of chromatin subfamily C [Nematocida sp. AWRm80]
MKDWNYSIDRVHIQSKPYKQGEMDKKNVVNISKKVEEKGEDNGILAREYPDLFKVLDNREGKLVLVPMHSSWFNSESINEIEKRAFKLESKEEEDTYMRNRNKIFELFQNNPEVYLSITQCRRVVSEDISVIIRIYSFLEHWGLINYKVGVKRDASLMLNKINQKDLFNIEKGSASIDDVTKVDPTADRMITVGESNIPVPRAQLSVQRSPIDIFKEPPKQFGLPANGPRIKHIPTRTNCTECHKEMNGLSGEDNVYFSDTDNIILCKSCFDSGKYPPHFSYSNFYLLESGVIRQIWSPKEEMLLLEGIEMYKDDWKSVSAHVKTKTIEQCVLHFLKIGIQEPFIEMEAISFSESKLPFNYSLNPVMTTIAFLASVVHPGVASAAAKSAAEEIQKLSAEKNNNSSESWLNDRLNEIAAVALSSCISRAQKQKDLEEGKKERLLELLIESEMKRIDAKVSEFNELSKTLNKEREDLEKMRETYRKAHMETRKEISEVISKVKRICEETGKNFEDVFFKSA